MALDDVTWKRDHDLDLHVLRTQPSRALRDVLVFEDDAGNEHTFAAYPGGDVTSVTFSANFLGNPHAHGVRIDPATGQITPDNPVPGGVTPIRNFIVSAVIIHTSALLASPHELRVRVQVHEDLTRLWLAPRSYRGHRNAEEVSLSVLAEFDDGVVGDITNWSDSGAAGLHWSSDRSADIDVHPDTGILDFKNAVARSNPVRISVRLGPAPPPANLSDTIDVTAGDPWSAATDVEHIAGPGPGTRNDNPNVLFLPDGFPASERAAFRSLVQNLAYKLQHRNSTRPFDLLKHRINYWVAWVASENTGITVLSEVGNQTRRSGGRVRADPIPRTIRHRPLGTDWTIEELIDAVGLPLRNEAPAGRGAKIPDWRTWFNAGISNTEVTTDVYDEWRSLRDRTLVNDQDTAFGLSLGLRPALEDSSTVKLKSHYRRISRPDFDRFLLGLRITGGPTIGALWSTGRAGGARGKDRGLVCLIGRHYRSGGTNRGDSFASTLRSEYEHRLETTTLGRVLAVEDHPIRATAGLDLRATVAHEAAHSKLLGELDDEYGIRLNLPASRVAVLAETGNLQARANLTTPGPNLNGARIRWRWPRIHHAATLTATLARLSAAGVRPARFEARLSAFAASNLALGDVVRLRTRPLLDSLEQTHRFEVTSLNSSMFGDTVELTEPNTPPFPPDINEADFVDGSVLFEPVIDAASGNEIELVHTDVVAHITASGGPLNAPSATPLRACVIDDEQIQRALNLPPSLRHGTRTQPRYSPWIVGLYEGGDAFHCGVYHPTGACLMRDTDTLLNARGATTIYRFCPVCRYVMVDAVDPEQHGAIETDYAARYPR